MKRRWERAAAKILNLRETATVYPRRRSATATVAAAAAFHYVASLSLSLLFFFFVPPIAAWGQPIRSTTTEKGGTENKKKNGNVTWSTVVVVLYGNFFLSFFFSYYTSLRLINSLASGGGQVEGGKFLYSASVKGTRPIQKIYFPTPFRRRRRHLPKGTYPFQGLVCLFGLGLDWPQPSGGWMLILGDLKTAGTQKKKNSCKEGDGRW